MFFNFLFTWQCIEKFALNWGNRKLLMILFYVAGVISNEVTYIQTKCLGQNYLCYYIGSADRSAVMAVAISLILPAT